MSDLLSVILYLGLLNSNAEFGKFNLKRFRDRRQILLLTSSEFKQLNNSYSPWNYQKAIGFLMISGGTEVNKFA